MGKLSDILRDGDGDRLRRAWAATKPAEDYAPLPAGEYEAHVIGCDVFASRTNGTPGVKLTYRVCAGEHTGRHIWHDLWLTEASIPMTKRDLGKLGITTLDQLDHPLPPGIRCSVKLALRRDDDGAEFNRVRAFTVIGIDAPERDAFAPTHAEGAGDAAGGPQDDTPF